MELINFLGLNCYHNCIISIANHFGMDYCPAFSNLWSERDFRYEIYRKVYLSQRLIENLALLGLRLEMRLCSTPEEAESNLAAIDDGELAIVGMDAFYIPWNQFYRTFHGPHYCIAQKGKAEEFPCFDPTYGRAHEYISPKSIVAHAFDISHLRIVAKGDFRADISGEAERILRTHEDTRQNLLLRMDNSEHKGKEGFALLAKNVDAMISNRYLFRHYLLEKKPVPDAHHSLFNREYFLAWTAIKNGLLKLAVNGANQPILQEVNRCFDGIIDREIAIANEMLYGP